MKDNCPNCNRPYTLRYKPCAHGREVPCVHGDPADTAEERACPNVIKYAVERKQQRHTCSEECYQKLRYDKQVHAEREAARRAENRGEIVGANHR